MLRVYDKELEQFQSTLLQEERHSDYYTYLPTQLISIHAPTRGATFCYFKDIKRILNFNPRSYKRSDLSVLDSCSQNTTISIHAPTRGATT